MYKTEKLYVIYADDSGHRHLIPKEYYNAFDKNLTRIEEAYDEHGDEDIYYEQLNDLLDHFSKHTLEGEPYYVVLPEDLVEGKE
jgi:hypothetical protein